MVTRKSPLAQRILPSVGHPLVAVALAVLSCSSPKADNAAGSDLADPNSPNAPAEIVPTPSESVPNSPTGEIPAPTTDLPTTESVPPSVESAQAAQSMEERVAPLVSSVSGAKLLFTACEADPCVARVQTADLSALHQVLTALSREFSGNIGFSAREQLDAYTGHSYQADVLLDVTGNSRAVPSTQEDLLTPP